MFSRVRELDRKSAPRLTTRVFLFDAILHDVCGHHKPDRNFRVVQLAAGTLPHATAPFPFTGCGISELEPPDKKIGCEESPRS
ncbi:MAG: hypothetical protein VX435_04420 [Planctomycetota bacterium]|nr:hypothetical protein [Planctomycetota bacterium]